QMEPWRPKPTASGRGAAALTGNSSAPPRKGAALGWGPFWLSTPCPPALQIAMIEHVLAGVVLPTRGRGSAGAVSEPGLPTPSAPGSAGESGRRRPGYRHGVNKFDGRWRSPGKAGG